MQDFERAEEAEATEGNDGYSQEFRRLAQEERGRSPEDHPAPERHEPASGEAAAGQADEAPLGSDAANPPSGDEAPDIWANADPALKAAHEASLRAAEERASRAEQQVRSNNGRLSQAHHELNHLKEQLAKGRDSGAAPAEGAEAQDEEERYKQLREEYPDVAAPLLDRMAQLEGTIRGLTKRADEAQLVDLLTSQEEALAEVHPNWTTDVADPRFLHWAQGQPRYVQQGIQRNANGIVDAAEAGDILSRFKAAISPERDGGSGQDDQLATRRRRQLEAARTVPAKSPTTAAGTPDDYSSEWRRLSQVERRERQQASQ